MLIKMSMVRKKVAFPLRDDYANPSHNETCRENAPEGFSNIRSACRSMTWSEDVEHYGVYSVPIGVTSVDPSVFSNAP